MPRLRAGLTIGGTWLLLGRIARLQAGCGARLGCGLGCGLSPTGPCLLAGLCGLSVGWFLRVLAWVPIGLLSFWWFQNTVTGLPDFVLLLDKINELGEGQVWGPISFVEFVISLSHFL